MKLLKTILAAAALFVGLQVAEVKAAPANETRLNTAEKVHLPLFINVSNTVNSGTRYMVPSPINGYVTGVMVAYEGPNQITSSSSNVRVQVSGSTVISVTVPSGTTALTGVSSTQAVSNTFKVKAGQVIEVSMTGSPVMSGTGAAKALITLTPNYIPSRFQQ